VTTLTASWQAGSPARVSPSAVSPSAAGTSVLRWPAAGRCLDPLPGEIRASARGRPGRPGRVRLADAQARRPRPGRDGAAARVAGGPSLWVAAAWQGKRVPAWLAGPAAGLGRVP